MPFKVESSPERKFPSLFVSFKASKFWRMFISSPSNASKSLTKPSGYLSLSSRIAVSVSLILVALSVRDCFNSSGDFAASLASGAPDISSAFAALRSSAASGPIEVSLPSASVNTFVSAL